MYYIGIDIGSVSVKCVVLDENKKVIYNNYKKSNGTPLRFLQWFLEDISMLISNSATVKIAVTGSGKGLIPMRGTLNLSEIIAHKTATHYFHPEVRTIFEIGGQDLKLITLNENGEIEDYALNDLCAAGTGVFLEEQALRLGLDIKTFADKAYHAKKGAKIAGRCTVFAKSDMIHQQQKGVPVDEIAYGVTQALVRNYFMQLVKGKKLYPYFAIQGGIAANRAVIRAFSEKLKTDKIIVPQYFKTMGALGSALKLFEEPSESYNLETVIGYIKGISGVEIKETTEELLPLKKIKKKKHEVPNYPKHPEKVRFLGIDIGSVSIDVVGLDKKGKVLFGEYLRNTGNPVLVLQEYFRKLNEKGFPFDAIKGVGVTGSGRELVGKLIGADVIKNEIIAQAEGTVKFFPEVDTIFEIGGQDSKFIAIKKGRIVDFKMNKICAAGTGSFLEEQAKRLGIDIKSDFQEAAFRSKAPTALTSRCTVFMESEIVNRQQKGFKLDDIIAGLNYSIAKNYIDNVAVIPKIGKHIVFQGGVSENRAVVSAMENLIGRKIMVHPFNKFSGAIGIAHLTMESYNEKAFEKTGFNKNFMFETFKYSSFTCRHCSNRCEVLTVKTGKRTLFMGDVCERYQSEKTPINTQVSYFYPDYIQKILTRQENEFGVDTKVSIGIPLSLYNLEFLPLFYEFFSKLGIKVVLSEETDESIASLGSSSIPVETCFPVKVFYGHILKLKSKGTDLVFMPVIKDVASKDKKGVLCFYSQYNNLFGKTIEGVKIFSPEIEITGDFKFEKDDIKFLSEVTGKSESFINSAFKESYLYYVSTLEKIKQKGSDYLNAEGVKIVFLGRPYNLFDTFLNYQIPERIEKQGFIPLPYTYIPDVKNPEVKEFPWLFSGNLLQKAEYIKGRDDIFPIIITNFGCGPDAFLLYHLEEILGDKPKLILEVDEHRGIAGIITRIEAFLDTVKNHLKSKGKKFKKEKSVTIITKKPPLSVKSKVVLPYFSDHVFAFSSALRKAGYNVEVLPLPDASSVSYGEKYSNSKECHPYTILMGDLLKNAEKFKKHKDVVYFFPGTRIPCQLNQYETGMNFILKMEKIKNIRAFAPNGNEFLEILGLKNTAFLWKRLVAIDYFNRLKQEKKVYEKEKGAVLKAYQKILEQMDNSDLEVETIIKEGLAEILNLVEENNQQKPIIGICGDIFTRLNPIGNDNLFDLLEGYGCEVWPAPMIFDIVDFGSKLELKEYFNKYRVKKAFTQGASILYMDFLTAQVKKFFKGHVKNFGDPSYKEVIAYNREYAHESLNEVIALNIAKMVDFAKKGANGVINAYVLNCMVGTVSTAVQNQISKDYRNIPIITLKYGGTTGTFHNTRIEAFVAAVREHFKKNLKVETGILKQD